MTMFGIAIELRGECPHCGNPVMVNALTERVHCPSCLTDRLYPYSEWADLLENVWSLRPASDIGHGGNTTILGANWHLMYARFDPYCYACKHDFDMALLIASPSPYACPGCGEPWHHRPAPPEAREAMPGLVHIVAEHPGQIPGLEADVPAPNSGKPILFACMGCGGALEVDGTERVITCKYCDASNYLPDDLWLRMHPVDTVRRWFIWLDEDALPAGDEDLLDFSPEGDEDQDEDESVARAELGLAEVLDEIDPPEDLTLEGPDDPAQFEPPFVPTTPKAATSPPRSNNLDFWLKIIGAAAVLVLLMSLWGLLFVK